MSIRMKVVGFIAFGFLVLSAAPIKAHHAFSAEFDATKPLKLEGAITEVVGSTRTPGSTSR